MKPVFEHTGSIGSNTFTKDVTSSSRQNVKDHYKYSEGKSNIDMSNIDIKRQIYESSYTIVHPPLHRHRYDRSAICLVAKPNII